MAAIMSFFRLHQLYRHRGLGRLIAIRMAARVFSTPAI